MATVDAAAVKKLREMTNAGIMDCKGALAEAGGDFDKAATLLREKGIASAAKKADRTAADGSIGVYVSDDGKKAALVEVNCETDFVAKNDTFQELVRELAKQAAESGAADVQSLQSQPFAADSSKTVEQHVKEMMGTLGENIVVARVTPLHTEGVVDAYVHTDGKQAAIVEIAGDNLSNAEALKTVARDIAMQAVALRAPYLSREQVPAATVEAEKDIYRKQALEEGKPEAMLDKIAEGRLNKFYSQETLLEQGFIKDPSGKQSVTQYVKTAAASAGENVRVARFVRFKVGEGS